MQLLMFRLLDLESNLVSIEIYYSLSYMYLSPETIAITKSSLWNKTMVYIPPIKGSQYSSLMLFFVEHLYTQRQGH